MMIQLRSAWRPYSTQPRRRYGTPPTSTEQTCPPDNIHQSTKPQRAVPCHNKLCMEKGCLLFAKSVPLSKAGKWSITLAPTLPIASGVVFVILHCLGNAFYAQEAVRRATVMETTCNLLNCFVRRDPTPPPIGKILHNLFSDDVIASYAVTSGVHLDPD